MNSEALHFSAVTSHKIASFYLLFIFAESNFNALAFEVTNIHLASVVKSESHFVLNGFNWFSEFESLVYCQFLPMIMEMQFIFQANQSSSPTSGI